MRPQRPSRRVIGCGAFLAFHVLLVLYAVFIEPTWLKVSRLDLSEGNDALRLVHISDIHFKGQERYLRRVVSRVNEQRPDFVCLTGDIVESRRNLEGALGILADIEAPVFAVPGNHEHWAGCSLGDIDEALRKRGGRMLVNESVSFNVRGRRIVLVGIDDLTGGRPGPDRAFPADTEAPGATVIVLTHSPALIERLKGRTFALALAGHSHGGQVRLPLMGAINVPANVGEWEKGFYETPAGRLYVNLGIGTWALNVRLLCRPEVTVIRM